MFSRFIQVIVCISHFVLWLNIHCMNVLFCHPFPSCGDWESCFVNMGVQASESLLSVPRSIAGLEVSTEE